MSAVAEMPAGPVDAPATPDAMPMRTADANRLLYADHAAHYDSAEHCVHHEGPRRLLAGLLDRAVAASPSPTPATLDACGGTGNVSELLAHRGIESTLVDVSPEMLSRWTEKAAALGVDSDIVESEIESFLATDDRDWELIVFSSALHHLDDYVAACESAAASLAPGGVLVTAFDPIRTEDRLTQRLRRFDYLLSLAAKPSALLAAVARKRRRREAGGVNVGDLAEKHALRGIDDTSIISALTASGLEIVEHRRYSCQRYRITEALFRVTRRSATFHLIARKPGSSSDQ